MAGKNGGNGLRPRAITEDYLFRSLLDNLPDSIYFKDSASRFLQINRALATKFGLDDPAQAVGKTDLDFFTAEHASRALEDEHRLLAGQEELIYKEEQETWPDGHITWVATTKLPLRDEQGAIIGTFGISRDITPRKRMEEALRLSESRTRLVVDRAYDAFVAMDAAGRVIDWNPRAEEIFGWSRPEILGQAVADTIIPERFRELHRKGLEKFLTTGEGPVLDQRIEIVAQNRAGREFPAELSVAAIRWQQTYIFSAFIHDITKRVKAQEELRKAKEQAEAANRAKSEFLANMSHEIRTPMNGVIGMTELALDTNLTAEQREYLGMVKASADSLLAVINDILDFSKIEARKLQLETIDFALRDGLGDAMKALGLRAQQKGIELVCHIAPDVPDDLLGDSLRLRQVIVNLVGNAIKFTVAGEVALHVTPEEKNSGDVLLHFAVADTGIGIPAEKQSLIFDAFAQADSSTTRRFGGTGLGLAISSQLIELMGGRIWVESEVGAGSTFHFTARFGLPQTPLAPKVDIPLANLHELAVLVVDDNATNRRILQEMLSNWGLKPTLADGAVSAREAARLVTLAGQQFPLVLLDGHMPETDGFTLAAELRSDPRFAGARIIMLTSAGASDDIARCRSLGIDAYLMKPVKQSELLDAIFTVMGTSLREAAAMAARPAQATRSLKILLAEDNLVNQRLASRLLEKQGHQVTIVPDGVQALAAFDKHEFDVILMDVQMPELDGFEATIQIRAREQGHGRHVPIVAMTAHAMKGDRERCLAVGMDGYISKPIQPQELYEGIETALAAHDARQTAHAESASSERVFNRACALQTVAGDETLLAELVVVFLDTYPTHMAGIQEAIDRHDARALQNLAHTLKGAVGTFGAQDAYDAALQLEEVGKTGDLTSARAGFGTLAQALERLHQALVEYRR